MDKKHLMDFQVKLCFLIVCLMVSALVSGSSPGRGHCAVFLAGEREVKTLLVASW